MQGFQQQVKRWPQQPLQRAVAWVRELPAAAKVADFGCGGAQLARCVPHTVASLDLVAANPGVIACNMAHTPLGVPLLVPRLKVDDSVRSLPHSVAGLDLVAAEPGVIACNMAHTPLRASLHVAECSWPCVRASASDQAAAR